MQVINLTRNVVLADRVEVAKTWLSRLQGLLLRPGLAWKQGLILIPCNSVHTCFMKFNIDILFVDEQGKIVHLIEDVAPFKFLPVVRQARYVIELPANTVNLSGTAVNDRLNLLPPMLQ